MTLDPDRLRADTPGCTSVAHFNNAGAALSPRPVTEAVLAHLGREQEIGGYEAQAEAAGALADFYAAMADLLGASAAEIAFVENATRAWDHVAFGLGLAEGDRVLTHAPAEYASNYMALLALEARGIRIDHMPTDADGAVDPDAIEIHPRTKLIALTHVPTHSGLVNPAAAVGAVARAHGVFYLLDACQSAGQLDLDVGALGCDALSGTGRKFLRGPRGTGFLYVRAGALASVTPPFPDLHSATWTAPDRFAWADGARRFETFERHVAGQIGLARAVRYALDLGLPAIAARIGALAGRLREGLATLPGVRVRDTGSHRCGIVTFDHADHAPDRIATALRSGGINVSVSAPAMARIDLDARAPGGLVRASPHVYNTEAEIDRLVAAVAAL